MEKRILLLLLVLSTLLIFNNSIMVSARTLGASDIEIPISTPTNIEFQLESGMNNVPYVVKIVNGTKGKGYFREGKGYFDLSNETDAFSGGATILFSSSYICVNPDDTFVYRLPSNLLISNSVVEFSFQYCHTVFQFDNLKLMDTYWASQTISDNDLQDRLGDLEFNGSSIDLLSGAIYLNRINVTEDTNVSVYGNSVIYIDCFAGNINGTLNIYNQSTFRTGVYPYRYDANPSVIKNFHSYDNTFIHITTNLTIRDQLVMNGNSRILVEIQDEQYFVIRGSWIMNDHSSVRTTKENITEFYLSPHINVYKMQLNTDGLLNFTDYIYFRLQWMHFIKPATYYFNATQFMVPNGFQFTTEPNIYGTLNFSSNWNYTNLRNEGEMGNNITFNHALLYFNQYSQYAWNYEYIPVTFINSKMVFDGTTYYSRVSHSYLILVNSTLEVIGEVDFKFLQYEQCTNIQMHGGHLTGHGDLIIGVNFTHVSGEIGSKNSIDSLTIHRNITLSDKSVLVFNIDKFKQNSYLRFTNITNEQFVGSLGIYVSVEGIELGKRYHILQYNRTVGDVSNINNTINYYYLDGDGSTTYYGHTELDRNGLLSVYFTTDEEETPKPKLKSGYIALVVLAALGGAAVIAAISAYFIKKRISPSAGINAINNNELMGVNLNGIYRPNNPIDNPLYQ